MTPLTLLLSLYALVAAGIVTGGYLYKKRRDNRRNRYASTPRVNVPQVERRQHETKEYAHSR
jgi:hypothetical protein